MTTKDIPCCNNCPYMKEWYHRVPEFLYCDLRKEEIPPSCQSLIQKVGCLFHPLAKEYLNEDAIKELEKKLKRANYDARMQGLYSSMTKAMAYEEAIELLGGNKK